jgi:uncharacterized membrane protein
MRKPLLLVVLVAALAGFIFAGFSTYDFVQHLDRQVHGLHCSFIPGLTGTDVSGASGCHVALMSPYSSFFRTALWGGLPISLPAMAVFAFLACRAVLALIREGDTTREIGWLVIAAVIPLLASTVMGAIAATQLSAFCKLCVGIYALERRPVRRGARRVLRAPGRSRRRRRLPLLHAGALGACGALGIRSLPRRRSHPRAAAIRSSTSRPRPGSTPTMHRRGRAASPAGVAVPKASASCSCP